MIIICTWGDDNAHCICFLLVRSIFVVPWMKCCASTCTYIIEITIIATVFSSAERMRTTYSSIKVGVHIVVLTRLR